MTDKDQRIEDGYQIAVQCPACQEGNHNTQIHPYCECGCH